MRVKAIIRFAKSVHASDFHINADQVVEEGGRYFFLGKQLPPFVHKGFFYAGVYLGKVKADKFFPSFNLLAILAESGGRSVFLDKKAAWLFICGRDIFFKGILARHGSVNEGDHLLVLNEYGECLGFGRAVLTLNSAVEANEVVIRNISDIGDFLRREPQH